MISFAKHEAFVTFSHSLRMLFTSGWHFKKQENLLGHSCMRFAILVADNKAKSETKYGDSRKDCIWHLIFQRNYL